VKKLSEGMNDINQLIEQQLSSQQEGDNDDSSSVLSENLDSITHTIISKLFKLQRSFEGKIMEFQHQLDVGKLQAEDAENLKFDLEILTEEKNW
jgi:hypothetical protein